MREIYLDNSSTTKPSESVISVMLKTMTEDYGNPSSMHRKGLDAERYVRNAREDIAKVLKASPAELVFTSGGTESNNMAIFGAAMAGRRRGRRILVSAMEHPAVSEPVRILEQEGFTVQRIGVDRTSKKWRSLFTRGHRMRFTMSMQFRHLENTGFSRGSWAST